MEPCILVIDNELIVNLTTQQQGGIENEKSLST